MTHEPSLPREHGPIIVSTNLMTTSIMASVRTLAYHQDVCLWRERDTLGGGGTRGLATPAEPLTSIFHMVTTPADRRLVQSRNLARACLCVARGCQSRGKMESCCPVVLHREEATEISVLPDDRRLSFLSPFCSFRVRRS